MNHRENDRIAGEACQHRIAPPGQRMLPIGGASPKAPWRQTFCLSSVGVWRTACAWQATPPRVGGTRLWMTDRSSTGGRPRRLFCHRSTEKFPERDTSLRPGGKPIPRPWRQTFCLSSVGVWRTACAWQATPPRVRATLRNTFYPERIASHIGKTRVNPTFGAPSKRQQPFQGRCRVKRDRPGVAAKAATPG